MTAPIYVGTRWDLDRFDPGPGLPVLTRSPSLVTVQDTLDAILVAAGKANIELRFSATGDPGNAPSDPYVTESELHAQLGTMVPRAAVPFTINSTDASGNVTSITYHQSTGDVTTTYTYGANGVATETTNGVTVTYIYSGGNLVGAS